MAELEERLRRLGESSSSFEWRRRAFFETLAKIRRQPLEARRQSPGSKVDRREFPRIALDVPGPVQGPDGGTAEVRVANLARGGAGILLTREAALSVFPDTRGATGQTLSLQFKLRLAASEQVSLRADCKVAWFRHLSYDDYRMGVQFLSFDHGTSTVTSWAAWTTTGEVGFRPRPCLHGAWTRLQAPDRAKATRRRRRQSRPLKRLAGQHREQKCASELRTTI